MKYKMKFNKELYSKTSLIKAAYNFSDRAYLHLDTDDTYYYVEFDLKDEKIQITKNDFINEMLAQSVRHEVYLQTKNIRELLMARAMATSVIVDKDSEHDEISSEEQFSEDAILKDWFTNEKVGVKTGTLFQ